MTASGSRQFDRTLRRIDLQFDECDRLTARHDHRVERVSGWSIGQHLDHLVKADDTLLTAIERPSEETIPPFSTLGRTLLLLRWIPRGRGRAPSRTQPAEPTLDTLTEGLAGIRSRVDDLRRNPAGLEDPRPVARHPYFGGMSMLQCWRFIEVHHHHHLKIARDLLRAD